MHRQQQNNMQHREQNIEQKTKHICSTQNNTQNNTENNTENRTQDTTICSAHNYRTYSLDYYFEFAYIKNSNTIEIYTILQDNVQKTLISSLYSFDFIV